VSTWTGTGIPIEEEGTGIAEAKPWSLVTRGNKSIKESMPEVT
jgi:hypothetical protein